MTTPTPTPTQPPAAEFPTEDLSLKTPTRDSFAGIAGQKPLPSLPEPTVNDRPDSKMGASEMELKKDDHQIVKTEDEGQDIEMEDASSPKEGSEDSVDGADGADGKASKKKKGQRFYCSDYPPCNLSFTRSEHLARHIR
jgi:hypothetical protein